MKGAIKPAVTLLRTFHSGYIGDYVTWFMIGSTIMMLASIVLYQ